MNNLTRNSGEEAARKARRSRLTSVFTDTKAMIKESADLQAAVRGAIEKTRLYPASQKDFNRPVFTKPMRVTVTNHRTFEAAMRIHAEFPDKRIGVLNFASATNPGGGVEWGSSAQEESLCRCSTLFPVLDQKELREEFYDFHWNRDSSLYTDACIYTPDIRIIKTDTDQPERMEPAVQINVDVITCAAPNLRHVERISDDDLERIHLGRGRKILDVAVENGIDCLVLGAFGCGAFRNDPRVVANAYAKLMEEFDGAFELVEFAVFYWGTEIVNYEAFKAALVKA